jgi:hypothetical protein
MGQQAIHQAALSQFNTFPEAQRWYARRHVLHGRSLGALINMIFLWLLDTELCPHLLLAGLISFFTATMICLIAILDHPFRGHVGVSPEAFELVHNRIMLKYWGGGSAAIQAARSRFSATEPSGLRR